MSLAEELLPVYDVDDGVGPGAHLLVPGLLDVVRENAEAATAG